ncbi:MAG: spore photoproduct lyase family protein [Phormidesmis sp.]
MSALSISPVNTSTQQPAEKVKTTRLWMPRQVLFTPAALEESWGEQIYQRVKDLGLPITKLTQNRITGMKGDSERETYAKAKQTMAVVTSPPSAFKLQPIPPSADWQFHLAEGCPAHCQYCYLASSISGPPVIRVFANLPSILENTDNYLSPARPLKRTDKKGEPIDPDRPTSFEVSCYTDPLSLEHLTGSLGECIRYFGTQPNKELRWVSKFDNVDPLLNIPHNGRTRCRVSVNADPVSHSFEGGTANVKSRLQALRKLALPKAQGGGGYPVGLVIAPIMEFTDWQQHYEALFEQIAAALDFDCDLAFELISHRFTAKSKEVLEEWYPNSKLDMETERRTTKRNKFGGIKYVYDKETAQDLRRFIETKIDQYFPRAVLLYWT